MQLIGHFFSLFVIFSFLKPAVPLADEQRAIEVSLRELELSECLLPKNHPLQKKLKNLFKNPEMFKTKNHFREEGFQSLSHREEKIMVASHPSIKKYLIKKFSDIIPQSMQTQNYIKRISGARAGEKRIANFR